MIQCNQHKAPCHLAHQVAVEAVQEVARLEEALEEEEEVHGNLKIEKVLNY